MTDPNWGAGDEACIGHRHQPGGRTCHAAIIARELHSGRGGLRQCHRYPARRHAGDGERAEGDTGHIYDGLLDTEVTEVRRGEMPEVAVKIMMNVGNPQLAFDFAQIPNGGVGLARLEFIINNNIGVHPKAILEYPNIDADLKRPSNPWPVAMLHPALLCGQSGRPKAWPPLPLRLACRSSCA